MNGNAWRSDYSLLLKCWAQIKSSELMKEFAYKQLKQFRANDKSLQRLKQLFEIIETKSSFDQSISLWKKAIDQFTNQKNYSETAKCYEDLADIELKYGKSSTQKNESFNNLIRAANYYKKSNDLKNSITCLKKAINLAEISRMNEINFIVDSYEDCSDMFAELGLHNLSQINQKNSTYLRRNNADNGSVDHLKASIPHNSHLNSEDESGSNSSHDSDSILETDSMDGSSDSSLHKGKRKKYFKKIKTEPYSDSSRTKPDYQNSSHSREKNEKNKTNDKSRNKLLPQNLRLIENLNKYSRRYSSEMSDSDDSNYLLYKSNEANPQLSITKQKNVNQVLETIDGNENTSKRKTKPKEESEELPEKRLIKLRKNRIKHNFIVDHKYPLKKLFCSVCEESILSYRWSIITDHLKSRKHTDYCIDSESSKTCETQIYKNENQFIDNRQQIPIILIDSQDFNLERSFMNSIIPYSMNSPQMMPIANMYSTCTSQSCETLSHIEFEQNNANTCIESLQSDYRKDKIQNKSLENTQSEYQREQIYDKHIENTQTEYPSEKIYEKSIDNTHSDQQNIYISLETPSIPTSPEQIQNYFPLFDDSFGI